MRYSRIISFINGLMMSGNAVAFMASPVPAILSSIEVKSMTDVNQLFLHTENLLIINNLKNTLNILEIIN
ncbi:hypothetical protein Lmor_0794 [Legionella moravica]|uniref:Uncharacterized protein n=1 Tax=Legionella moravica TaxID=39962 RepID=A0A378JTH5_9GAMM|nr:hypothetical protein [Legionella moravica]KTD35347.1 hypothetical protein Lmor_0794 [Legionella moravica]STX61953.1 Uncharacterised protein [Legionella moravica]